MEPLTDFTEDLMASSLEQERLANLYATSRKQYGVLKGNMDIILASKMSELHKVRKNVGYEAGLLMIIEGDKHLQAKYMDMTKAYNDYKSIEKLIEAQTGRQMTLMSIMRYNRINEGGPQ